MVSVLFFSILLSAHPVHVSMTSIDYITENQSFNVFVKILEDDFIKDYKLTFGNEPYIDSFKNSELTKEDAEKYINSKMQILADDKKLSGVIENIEISDEEIKLNMSFKFKGKADSFTIRNLLMNDLYADQTNMLIFKYKEIEEGIKFTSDIIEQTIITK